MEPIGPMGDVEPAALERDCFRVIAYFAHFHYPLTAFEVWKWLQSPSHPWSLHDVMTALAEGMWLGERVAEWNGFYGFGDVATHWHDRHVRYLDAVRKYRVLRPVVEYIGRLPGVEGVAVCNSLAYHHTTPASDIDLFILTEPSRVWTVRLLAVSMMAMFRKRPHETSKDPICCSFFVDRTAYNLAPYKIAPIDPYLLFWSATLIPLVERNDAFAAFRSANDWAFAQFPQYRPVTRARAFRPNITSRIGPHPISERAARRLQERKFPRRITAMQNLDTRVVVNDHVLKFHENDRRQEIAKALADKLA